VRLLRWLGVLSCLCLLAVPVQAQPTVQDFSNPGVVGTNYTEHGNVLAVAGTFYSPGPPGALNFYRLTATDVGSTNNMIAFDVSQPGGPTSSVTVDFDYRIGGHVDNGSPTSHADGIGFCLLNTALYGQTGNGPGITEEATGAARNSSLGLGLDTWDNSSGGLYDPDNNHISLNFSAPGKSGVVHAVSFAPFGYELHQGEPGDAVSPFADSVSPFDHLNMTVAFDASGAGATVTVTITPGAGRAPGGAFTPISGLFIPGLTPYEMRAAFGARTGGSTDNHDLANVNIVFN
jgi:hypothetical protein